MIAITLDENGELKGDLPTGVTRGLPMVFRAIMDIEGKIAGVGGEGKQIWLDLMSADGSFERMAFLTSDQFASRADEGYLYATYIPKVAGSLHICLHIDQPSLYKKFPISTISVEPALRTCNGTLLPLSTLSVISIHPRIFGSVKNWRQNMTTIFEAGYSGIHFLPFHKTGRSGSTYSIIDFNSLEPELQCCGNFIDPPEGGDESDAMVFAQQLEETEKDLSQFEKTLKLVRKSLQPPSVLVADAVWGHTNTGLVDSKGHKTFLSNHIGITFTTINTPHLLPAALMDLNIQILCCAITEGAFKHIGIDNAAPRDSTLPGNSEISRSFIGSSRALIRQYLQKMKLEEFYHCSVTHVLRTVELQEFADAGYLGFMVAKDGNHYAANRAFGEIIKTKYSHYENIIRHIGPSFLETEKPPKSFGRYTNEALAPNQDELHQGGIARFLIDNCFDGLQPKRKGYQFNIHKMAFIIGKCYASNNSKPPEMMFVKNSIVKTIQFHNEWETYRMADDLETSVANCVEEIRFNLFSEQGPFYNKVLKAGDRIVKGGFEFVSLPTHIEQYIREGSLYSEKDYDDYVGKSGVPICRIDVGDSSHITITAHDLLMIQTTTQTTNEPISHLGYVENIKRAGISPITDCDGLLAMARAGWIGLPNTTSTDLTDFNKRRLLRREVNSWGDSVRLRYIDYCTCRIYQDDFLRSRIVYPGIDMSLFIDDSKCCPLCLRPFFGSLEKDEQALWDNMTRYTNFLAKHFDGIRIDNAHGTPEHVYGNLLRHARGVNPNLLVTPELFVDSDSECRRISADMGATCCPVEGVHIRNHFEATGNILAATNAIGSNGKKADYYKILTTFKDTPEWFSKYPMYTPEQLNAHVSRYPAILYDVTHDNDLPGISRYAASAQHLMFMMAMACSVSRPIGTTYGIDIMLNRRLTVLDRRALPPVEDIKEMYVAMRNGKQLDSDSIDHENTANTANVQLSDVGLIRFRKSLNLLHELANIYFTNVYADYHNGALVTTRVDPDTGMGLIIIAKDDFGGKARYTHDTVARVLEENPVGESNEFDSLVIKSRSSTAPHAKPPLYPSANELRSRNYVPLKMSPLVPLRSHFDCHQDNAADASRGRAAKTQAVARFKPKATLVFKKTESVKKIEKTEEETQVQETQQTTDNTQEIAKETTSASPSTLPSTTTTAEQAPEKKTENVTTNDLEVKKHSLAAVTTLEQSGMYDDDQGFSTEVSASSLSSISPSLVEKETQDKTSSGSTEQQDSSESTGSKAGSCGELAISPFTEKYEIKIPFKKSELSTILFCQSCLEEMGTNPDNGSAAPNAPYGIRPHVVKFRQNSVREMYQQFNTVFEHMNEDGVHPLVDEGLVQSISDCVRALDTEPITMTEVTDSNGTKVSKVKIHNFNPGDVVVLFVHPCSTSVLLSNMRKESENTLLSGQMVVPDPTVGLSATFKAMFSTIANCFHEAPTALADLLFVTKAEAEYDRLYGPYKFGDFEPSYCGLMGLAELLYSDSMWVDVLNNLGSGNWLIDYIVGRMKSLSERCAKDEHDTGIRVHSQWCETLATFLDFMFKPLKEQPSFVNGGTKLAALRNLVFAFTNATELVLKVSSGSLTEKHNLNCGIVNSSLNIISLSFTRICRRQPGISPYIFRVIARCCAERLFVKSEAFKAVLPSMCAGFPHFAVDFMRNWGRDTFIALPGILSTSVGVAKEVLRTYAMVVRHGLVPNLLASGVAPRYNARDASWHFLHCVAVMVDRVREEAATKGESEEKAVAELLNMAVFPLFPSDNQDDYNVEHIYDQELGSDLAVHVLKPQYRNLYAAKPLKHTVLQILSAHLRGINFREWDAGPKIDQKMRSIGFNITAGVLYGRDIAGTAGEFHNTPIFVTGGNIFNCGTWMDKMGESSKAGTYGVPSTPRYGCAVELQGLCHSILSCLTSPVVSAVVFEEDGRSGADVSGVRSNTDVTLQLLTAWRCALESEFAKFFFVPANQSRYNSAYVKDTLVVSGDPHTNVNIDMGTEEAKYVRSRQSQNPEMLLRPNYCTALAVSPSLLPGVKAAEALMTARRFLVQKESVGAETLCSKDEQYVSYYDQGNDSNDSKVARGFSYHNGPEWVHMYGYLLRAEVRSGLYDAVGGGFDSGAFCASLSNISLWLRREKSVNGAFRSLPELTNANGRPCSASCSSQAWAVGTVLEAIGEANRRRAAGETL